MMHNRAIVAVLAALMLASPLLVTGCTFTGDRPTSTDNLNSALPASAFPTFNADGTYKIYTKNEVVDHFANQRPTFRNASQTSFSCVDARGTVSVRRACGTCSGRV